MPSGKVGRSAWAAFGFSSHVMWPTHFMIWRRWACQLDRVTFLTFDL